MTDATNFRPFHIGRTRRCAKETTPRRKCYSIVPSPDEISPPKKNVPKEGMAADFEVSKQ